MGAVNGNHNDGHIRNIALALLIAICVLYYLHHSASPERDRTGACTPSSIDNEVREERHQQNADIPNPVQLQRPTGCWDGDYVLPNCGDLCNLRLTASYRGGHQLPFLKKRWECPRIIALLTYTVPPTCTLPLTQEEVPIEAWNMYTNNSWYPVTSKWLNATVISNKWKQYWVQDKVNWCVQQDQCCPQNISKRNCAGSYGVEVHLWMREYLLEHVQSVKGKDALVIGSQHPWLETLLLSMGARHVFTLEYDKLETKHPQLTTLLPDEAVALFEKGQRFDVVVSYSSLEHSGLTRYGDPPRPFGDLEAAAQAWCMLKPGGTFVLGVPARGNKGPTSALYWNAHREYNIDRLTALAANFRHKGAWRRVGGHVVMDLMKEDL
eukprot:TRINITY_DN33469_c0_g1_i1.p1 TRINITY_DN33469_c0_g1~~TRINITY_DN33469_c0_g1_i1.p1  ORF type:complete len:380 (+),score=46.43 TRINITY_DN33469_c0_g1_i1:49-1188(+)